MNVKKKKKNISQEMYCSLAWKKKLLLNVLANLIMLSVASTIKQYHIQCLTFCIIFIHI